MTPAYETGLDETTQKLAEKAEKGGIKNNYSQVDDVDDDDEDIYDRLPH